MPGNEHEQAQELQTTPQGQAQEPQAPPAISATEQASQAVDPTNGDNLPSVSGNTVMNPSAILVGQGQFVAEERHPRSRDTRHVEYVIILKFDDSYLKTLAGVIRFLQVVLSLIALICLVSSGMEDGGYLLLPLNWHLRTFVFVAVSGFLTSLLIIVIHITGLIQTLPINWAFFDAVVYAFLAFMFLFSTSLVASAIDFYQKLDSHVTQWTVEQLIVSVVLGYVCLFLYGATGVMGYRRWKGLGQFQRYRLKPTHSVRSAEVA